MEREENSYWREAGTARGAGHERRDLLEDMLSRPAGGGFSLEREVTARPLLAFGAALAAGFLLGSMGDQVGAPARRSHDWLAPLDRELDLLKGAAMATFTAVATENIRQMVPGQTGEAITSMISRKLQDMGVPAGGAGAGGFASQQAHSQASYAGTGGFAGQQSYRDTAQGHSQANLTGQSDFGSGRSERAGTGIGRDTGAGFGGTQPSSAPNTSFSTGAGVGAVGYDSPPAQGGSVSIENTRVQGVSHLDPYYPPGGSDKPIAGGETPGTDKPDDLGQR